MYALNKFRRIHPKIKGNKIQEDRALGVMTVNGEISAAELGIVAPHEHIVIDTTNFYKEPDAATERIFANKKLSSMRDLSRLRLDPSGMRDNFVLNDPEIQMREIMEFSYAGGRTIVDQTLKGIGRDVVFLREVANKTGLNIIAGTGYYVASSHPEYISSMDAKEISKLMCFEINNGIDNTDIKPGVIGEIGVGYEFHPDEKKVISASAETNKETGLPLMIHINPWSENGIPAMEVLKKEEVDPTRICICHIDGENRKDYIYRLLDMGIYIEFDNFGKEFSVLNHKNIREGVFNKFVSDWQREQLLIELIEKGYKKQILVSCDVCLKMFLLEYGGHGYAHFIKNIVPELLIYGISQETIDTLLIHNPADFLDVK